MLSLARLALKGPLAAASVASGLLFLGLLLPLLAGPIGVFITLPLIGCSAAVVSLVLLRRGPGEAISAIVPVLLMVVVMGLLSRGGGGITQLMAILLQFWLPAILVAYALRLSVRLDVAVLVAACVGVATLVVMHIAFGDTTAFWERVMGAHIDTSVQLAEEQAGAAGTDPRLQAQVEALRSSLGVMARIATPATAVMMMMTGLGSVFLARSWQAQLFNPGGFQQEFHKLRLGKTVSLGVLVVTGLSLLAEWTFLSDVVVVLLAAVMIQGLAVLHGIVKIRGMSAGWLTGTYLMMILPHTSALVGALGIADNWLNIRQLPDDETSD